jgi:hypothetical protein
MTILQHGIAQAAAGATGYQIARSLRFNSADSTTLSRTHSAGGSKTTWTYSTWIKRSALYSSADLGIFATMPSPQQNRLHFQNTDRIVWLAYTGGGFVFQVLTSQVFRDVGAWFHLVAVVDSTNATTSERIRLYVNGSRITSLDVASYPSQNADCLYNGSTVHEIGGYGGGNYFNGYFSEIHFVDGQALDPSYFGETSTATGVWMPKQVTGMTYGTNGFYLKLDDNSNNTATTLGKDSSGNSNNWTPNNFSVTAGVGNDSLVDSPTNYGTDSGVGGEVRGNYCTYTPLSNTASGLANGNLDLTASGPMTRANSTIAVSSGKWYYEIRLNTAGTNSSAGIGQNFVTDSYPGYDALSYAFEIDNARIANNNTLTSYGTACTAGDTFMCAVDLDNNKIFFGKNGTWFNSSNPATGTSPAFTITAGTYCAIARPYGGSAAISANFGQRPFSYTAPSGFKALCTQNLPTPAIGATSSTLASKNMNVVTYTGNDTNGRSITGVGFQPDLVWIKMRSGTAWHIVSDAVRGANINFFPNSTDAEITNNANGYTSAFNSDGFVVTGGSTGDDNVNNNASTYVAWNWNAGGSTVTNTSGTISSQVRANTAAGISVVTYTGLGNSGSGTVGHGLGAAPKLIICKSRNNTPSATPNWPVYHASIGKDAGLCLNTNAATFSSSNYWGTTTPGSTTFGVVTSGDNNNGNMVAYCFAEVAGFSKFGSYTGNGSADGPFVYCGFRPRFVMIKNASNLANWTIVDTSRNSYNVADARLFPSTSGAEATSVPNVDILSNGFKVRVSGATDNGANTNGDTYIFAAFGESPFNYSRAR